MEPLHTTSSRVPFAHPTASASCIVSVANPHTVTGTRNYHPPPTTLGTFSRKYCLNQVNVTTLTQSPMNGLPPVDLLLLGPYPLCVLVQEAALLVNWATAALRWTFRRALPWNVWLRLVTTLLFVLLASLGLSAPAFAQIQRNFINLSFKSRTFPAARAASTSPTPRFLVGPPAIPWATSRPSTIAGA